MYSWYIVPFIIIKCHLCLLLLFYFEIHFVIYKYCCTHFSLDVICFQYHFPHFHFESIFALATEMCLLKTAYGWVVYFDTICYSVTFNWWVQSIYISGYYSHIRAPSSHSVFCFLLALCLYCFFSLACFSVILVWWYFMIFFPSFPLWFMCLSSRFLFCGYH